MTEDIRGVDRRAMAVLSLGHLFSDATQVAVPALLPFLVREQGISYAAAGMLVLASTVASSVVQPLFGHLSDRRSFPVFMPLGLLVGGVGIALVGVAPSYPLVVLCVILSGLGVAAFHPEASRFASLVSGDRRATGMSYFSVGGTAGFAVGPLLLTPLVLYFGLPGTLFFAIPPAVVAVAAARELPRLSGFRSIPVAEEHEMQAAEEVTGARERWKAFVRLSGVISVRSILSYGLTAFVPLYFTQVFSSSVAAANGILSLMLLAGTFGSLLGGRLADRFGRRPVLVVSLVVRSPLLLAFVFSGEVAGALLLVFAGLSTAGFGITTVMGQEYLPGRTGLASGLTLGLATGVGGVGSPVLGALADGLGLTAVMVCLALLPVPAALLALSLPRETPTKT